MPQTQAQRILIEHRYRRELPFPISTAFAHYGCSPTKNNAVRAWRLVTAAESTLRYAAIVAVCDYATNPAADDSVLAWLRQEWLGAKALSFGAWSSGLLKVRKELGKTWQDPFVPEFGQIRPKRLNAAIEPLVNARNQIAHGERVEVLSYQHFVRQHEDDLFSILEELNFLSGYHLCFAEIDEDDGHQAVPGSRQTISLCRGASRSFVQCLVTPTQPLASGIPFIWNRGFDGVLFLSPFFIYGRASTDPDLLAGKRKSALSAQLQGLMVVNRAQGRENYASLDQEARISLSAFVHPFPDDLQEGLSDALTPRSSYPARLATAIPQREREGFGRQPGDVPVGYTFTGEQDIYTVEREPVGRGGMGVVYLVRRQSDGIHCALKAMPLEIMAVGSLVKRFEREGRVLLELSKEGNPNLIRLLDVGYQEPYHFLVMEYVEGGTLADDLWQRSGNRPPYSFGEALDIMGQACNGVRAVHGKNMVHRDLKPGNMLLGPRRAEDGTPQPVVVKITDFGLARRLGQQSVALTMELGALGTFQYMPPEQFAESGQAIDQRADVYALGKILAEMLTGVVPRNAEEVETLDFTSLQKAPEPGGEPQSGEPAFPGSVPVAGLKRILTCALAKDPSERFGRVEDLMDALRQASRVDEADRELQQMGVMRSDIRAAFGLARIGHPQARRRLLDWCADDEDPRHREAAVVLTALDADGLQELVREAELVRTGADEKRARGLVHAIACALRWKEQSDPRLLGQPWLAQLSRPLRREVQRIYVRERLEATLRELAATVTNYAGMAVIFGASASLLCSMFGASVFWRISTGPEKPFIFKVLFTLGPWILAPFVFGGASVLAGELGSALSRPSRFLGILGVGTFLSALVGLLAWGLANACFQPIGQIPVQIGVDRALAIFQAFWWWAAFLLTFGMTCAFVLKELPAVQRRRPHVLLSCVMFTALPALLFLPVAFQFIDPFLPRETFGVAISIAASGLGAGIADWMVDRRRMGLPKSAGQREGGGPPA